MHVQGSARRPEISFFMLFLSAVISATLAMAQSTSPPANLTARVVLYSSNQCCGGSIGFDNVKPDECITLGPTVDPAVYGNSIFVYDIWADGFDAWGYASGFRAPNCSTSTKVLELREPSCIVVSTENRVRSFSWTLETYTFWPPSYTPWTSPQANGAPTGIVESRMAMDGSEGCRKADWFEYFDRRLGRTRRIEVLGSEEVLRKVTSLYSAQEYVGLSALEEMV